MSQPPAMSNKLNYGPERRFLDLDALTQCMQAMPILVRDVRNFSRKVDDGMTAHVERLNEVCRLTLWLKANFEQMATQVANLQTEVSLLQGMLGTRSFHKEDWQLRLQEEGLSDQMTGAQDREMATDDANTEKEDDRLGLHETESPHQVVAHAQDGGMTADPVQGQGINAAYEAVQGQSGQEFDTKEKQLAWEPLIPPPPQPLPSGIRFIRLMIGTRYLDQKNQRGSDAQEFHMHILPYEDRATPQWW